MEVRREVEVDTKLAELYEAAWTIKMNLDRTKDSLASAVGVKAEYVGRMRVFNVSFDEVLAKAQAMIENPNTMAHERRFLTSSIESREEMLEALRANRDAAEPLEAEFDANPWSRFFLVNNNGGHIHSSMHCSTCFITTEFGWLPTLSGLTEKDAVEDQGSILCTVCFPSAPVEWTGGVSKADQAARDERAAAKAAREAAKAAKAITAPDGSTLKDKMGFEIKTEVTARRELSSALQNEKLGYGPEYTAYAERLAAAIANKTGENAEELLSTTRVKAAKAVAKWAA